MLLLLIVAAGALRLDRVHFARQCSTFRSSGLARLRTLRHDGVDNGPGSFWQVGPSLTVSHAVWLKE